MKRINYENFFALRGMLVLITAVIGLSFGCANHNGCMPGGTYGPYNGYPYAGQPGQPVYPSQMVGTNPGMIPGQPNPQTFAPQGYPPGTQYPPNYYQPQGMPGGQPMLGR